MKYTHWTTFEIRKLRDVHIDRYPSHAELIEMFPCHALGSIRKTAHRLKLRQNPFIDYNLKWLRIAHLHFAERDFRNEMAGAITASCQSSDGRRKADRSN